MNRWCFTGVFSLESFSSPFRTLRATTREQFRIVLRWVKEYPVLARSDNEVEKDGRELKTQLWKKLAIELNEIGPPVRAWMAWKRVS